MSRPSHAVLPARPLVLAVEREGAGNLAHLFGGKGRLRRDYNRAVAQGALTAAMADELCVCVLGCVPTEIYGDEFYLAPMFAKPKKPEPRR